MKRYIEIQRMPAVERIIKRAEMEIKSEIGIQCWLKLVNYEEDAEKKPIDQLSKIKDVVCEYYGLKWSDIISKSRVTELVRARHTFCYISMNVYGYGPSLIGRELNRDHSTACVSSKTAAGYVDSKDPIADDIYTIILMLSDDEKS